MNCVSPLPPTAATDTGLIASPCGVLSTTSSDVKLAGSIDSLNVSVIWFTGPPSDATAVGDWAVTFGPNRSKEERRTSSKAKPPLSR